MAELEQTSVEVQCSDGTFLNILLDATMAEQLRNGQIFLTEENGQIGIQQQDGQICLLEYADQTDVAVENTGRSFSEALFFASTNPKYDKRLFIESRVRYMKTTSSEHIVYMNCSELSLQKQTKILF